MIPRLPARRSHAQAARLICALLVSHALLAAVTASASAARWDWSGSLTADYKKLLKTDDAESIVRTGAILEWAQKVTADVSDKITLNAKVCSSCHGFEIDQAYAEVRPHRLVNVEVGRINVPFGDFYLRHDPANDVFLSKPLPYAMGHMLRRDAFNLGVIPMPYVDNGASFFGDFWVRETTQIWYALYVVNGFRSGTTPADFDFKVQTGDDALIDNNDQLSWGTRLSVARGEFTLGGSYLHGNHDLNAEYDYGAWGLDASAMLLGVRLRSEYLERRTAVAFEGRRRNLRKKGFTIQAEAPVGRYLMGVARFEGLLREGPPTAVLDSSSGIVRWTLGLNVMPTVDFSVRAAVEHWRFTDFADTDVIRLGTVLTY